MTTCWSGRGGSGMRLSLIACPAGFGKTTLLAAWREAEVARRPVAAGPRTGPCRPPARPGRWVRSERSPPTLEPVTDRPGHLERRFLRRPIAVTGSVDERTDYPSAGTVTCSGS